LELATNNQTNKFMYLTSISIENQAVFRNHHSRESSLNKVLNTWKIAIEEEKVILCVFLGFKRTSETVDRAKVLKNLELHGFVLDVPAVLKSYLMDQKRQGKFDKSWQSNEQFCAIRFPQKSVLSPLLFTLSVSDVSNVLIKSSINLFANDTLLWVMADSLEEASGKMNQDLAILNDWLNLNKLAVNASKTKAMIISLKSSPDTKKNIVKVVDDQVDYVEEFKYLGVWLDRCLDFNKHLEYLERKMLGKYHLLKRVSQQLDTINQDLLYKSLITPQIDPNSSILFLCNDSQLERLQRIQNRMMRLILRVPWNTRTSDMLNRLGWLSIKQRIYFNTMKFIYKIEEELDAPGYLKMIRIEREDASMHYPRERGAPAKSQNPLNCKALKLYNDFNKIYGHIGNMKLFWKTCLLFVKEKV
jgi:hypothetical protein